MEFTGRITKVLTPRTGTSQRTGNEWTAYPFVFEYFENQSDRYADSVLLETFDTNIGPALKEGLEVRVGFGHRAKEITSRDGQQIVINELRMYSIQSIRKQQAAPQPAPQQQPAYQPAPQQFPPQTDANGYPIQQPANNGGQADDLPF